MSDMHPEQNERHTLESPPLQAMTAALGREAQMMPEHLDPNTAKNQRLMLLNMVNAQQTSEIGGRAKIAKPSPWRLWLMGGVMAFAACILFAVVTQQYPVSNGPTPIPSTDSILSQLRIPEAHAGDAFMLIPTLQDAAGVSTETAFTVTSAISVTADQLQQQLRIVPPVPFEVTSIKPQEFRVQPKAALEPGEVYRFALAATVDKQDGSTLQREFSWAIQTKDVFRILSSVPGNASTFVPRDTGIEVTASYAGWEDPKTFFSITPAVDGHFETHGRSLAFVPSSPLQAGRLYTVTYKKGWKLAGSDLALTQDYVFRFETETGSVKTGSMDQPFIPQGVYFETAVQKEAFIPVSLPSCQTPTTSALSVTGFSLSPDEAKAMILQMEGIPAWARMTRERGEVFAAVATRTAAFQAPVSLVGDPYLCRLDLRIPGVRAGIYAVRITSQAASSTSQWFLLQVTNVATYTIVDAKKIVLWAMDMDTKQPLSQLAVRMNGQMVATTNQDGVATMMTPMELTSTSTSDNVVIVDVGEVGRSALVPLAKSGFNWTYAYRIRASDDAGRTQALLFPDRPLYHPHDSLSFFGLGQDRDTHLGADGMTVQLRSNSFVDFGTYKSKNYVETKITQDRTGFFQGTLAWDRLMPGYYELVLQRDGHDVLTRGIEIRDFIKPAYTIDILPTKKSIYAGEAMDGQVKVSLFDGTPFSKQKVTLEVNGADGYGLRSIDLITDENGLAEYHLPTKIQPCNLQTPRYVYCNEFWPEEIIAHAMDGEEARIQASVYVNVWSAHVSLDQHITTKDNEATVNFVARRVDLTKAEGRSENIVLADPIPGMRIHGNVIEQHWVRTEQGTMYDFREKKVVSQYRYDLQEKIIKKIDLVSDGQGRASTIFPMGDNVSYRFVAEIIDEHGAQNVATGEVSKGWYEHDVAGNSTSITLQPTTPRDDRPSYVLDEPVSVSFFKGGQRLIDDHSRYLYVEASRGIREMVVSKRATYEFHYRKELVPSMVLYGIRFDERGFTEATYYAAFDPRDQALNIMITPDKTAYAPGESVHAVITVQTPAHVPVADAKVAVSTVDRALLAASGGDRGEYPLQALYADVPIGILLTRVSHNPNGDLHDSRDGFGGGGGDSPRRNFKDTADFQVLTTDQTGHATLSFTAPDNITSWNMFAVGVTSDLKAGTASKDVAVTKPVFVEAVIPQSLLTADTPVIKLRAFGAGLQKGSVLQFTVDAPSLGIAQQHVTGTVGAPVYVAIDKLVPGDHRMIIRLQTTKGTDTLERHLQILTSRFTKDEFVKTELGPGSTLPDAGVDAETQITFVSLSRTRFIPLLRSLANPWSARVESRVAAGVARQYLRETFEQSDIDAPESTLVYQRPSGGITPLPYASEDVELSAKMAAIAPTMFDAVQLANYLWTVADKKEASREEAIQALSGLAALDQPVLNRLHILAQLKDLSWREQLALVRGLEAAGDREGARIVLLPLLEQSENRDGLIHLTVDSNPRFRLESTAEAAALAASIGDARADGLNAYIEKNWAQDAFSDLDRIAYIQHRLPALSAEDASLIYAIGNTEQHLEFHDGNSESLVLTAQEIKQFRAVAVRGGLAAVFTRRVPGKIPPVSEVHLSRVYQVNGVTSTAFIEGDRVNVTLTPSWEKQAQDGCYVVRDRLPSGLAPVQTIASNVWPVEGEAYPVALENNEISFVTCKNAKRPVKYQARVVARGTYKAEAASLQSMDAPSVAALSDETMITVK